MFNKERFSELLTAAQGNRSLNAYAAACNVAAAHISRLKRQLLDTSPTPPIIKKLAENAMNGVTYKEFMIAAGHIDEQEANFLQTKELNEFIKEKVLQEIYNNRHSKNDFPFLSPELKKDILEYKEKGDMQKISDLISEYIDKAINESTRVEEESTSYCVEDLKIVNSVIKVPVLGTIPAGLPIFAEENINGYKVIPNSTKGDGSDIFILNVKGDSMIGSRIYEGDQVVVRAQQDVENGEIAVVKVNGDDATLKKVKKYEDGSVWLVSTNEKYAPIPLSHKKAKIVGKVIQVIFEP